MTGTTTVSTSNNFAFLDLKLRQLEFHLFAALFIAGNLFLPILIHLIPRGGEIFLPIYFFTLIGSYKFGWRMGLVIALVSPLLNNVVTGFPAGAMLAITTIKSLLLVFFCGWYSKKNLKFSLLSLLAVIVSYQFVGLLVEFIIRADAIKTLSNLFIHIPGLLLQLFGGYLILKKLDDYGEEKLGGNHLEN